MTSSRAKSEPQSSSVITPNRGQVSWEDLHAYLYGHVPIHPMDPRELEVRASKRRRQDSGGECSTASTKSRRTTSPLAALVFPDEVRLCRSSIPGAKFGVCAARTIPPGTWIGPYEGHIITKEEMRGMDSDYMWEIYKDGRFSHYIDGEDESLSSWMRYIQCARYREEQNMTVFQYCGNIYYRAYKHIPEGRELKVWYDEKYSELIDIPALLKDQKENTAFWRTTSVAPHEHSVREGEMYFRDNREAHGLDPLQHHQSAFYSIDFKDSNEPSTWRCGQCSQTFSQRVLLQMHICPQSPDRPYQCGHCPASFQEANELRDHVVTHINEKPFKCGFCNRSFAGATTLNNHIRTHTGEKPFKCLKCNKTFTQSTQLSRHQKSPDECIGGVPTES